MADEEPKAMDISKPGNQAPSKTSRPIISKHKMVQDPMVKDDPKPEPEKPAGKPAEDTTEEAAPSSRAKTIAPLDSQNFEEEQKQDAGSADSKPEETEAPDSEKDEPSETEEKKPDAPDSVASDGQEAPTTEDESEKEAKEEAAIVGAVADQAAANKGKDPGNQDVEDTEKQKKITQLIEDKTYFLPIGEATRRKQNQQALFILIPLLMLAGLYLAADYGLVKLPFDLPLEFFRGR